MEQRFETIDQDGTSRTIEPRGRDAWALAELIRAGNRGCTPVDQPGPRWSAYIFNLRREYGLAIETIHEPHGGSFPGTHARYILRSRVRTLEHEGQLG